MEIENNVLRVAGDFKVIQSLASSNFSNVYIAQEQSSGKNFALKAIKYPNNKQRVSNEIAVMKKLKSSHNMLRLYKVFKDNKKLFFVYELANNGDLYDYVQQKGPIAEEELMIILYDLLITLRQAHDLDIIHMDIKPENVLINDDKYCLCDWGLSKKSESIKIVSAKTDNIYTAPEIFEGFSYKSSDIYSLGMTMYYLATGERGYDFTHKDDMSYVMYAHCNLSLDFSLISSHKIRYLIERMTNKHYMQRATIDEIMSFIWNKDFDGNVQAGSVDYSMHKNKSKYELYEELSQHNIPFAQNNLGLLYEVEDEHRDFKKSSKLYELATQSNFTKSYFHLALCYKEGKGLEQDLEKAFELFKKAAINNHEKSIYHLAHFYENGIVVPRDLKKAVQLYFESANLGNKQAYEKLSSFQ